MKSHAKKRALQIALLVLVLAIIFLPQIVFSNLKAYLTQPLVASEPVWGQAYSSNAGWINFYCNGANGTIPAGKSGGVATMPDACGSIPYQTAYNPATGDFSGEAYSSNYGWINMSGVHMVPPTSTSDVVGVTGSTTSGSLSPYNFGTTYFGAGTPNAFNPGVRYYNPEAYFCGFAYSDQVGYISLCDPQTKERAPKNVSVNGFDWNSYAVYMGTTVNTPTSCGDDIVQSPEVCDGTADAACPGLCDSSCTCTAVGSGICGDDIVQSPNSLGFSEVCDGAADAACPGLCTGSCSCTASAGAPILMNIAPKVLAATDDHNDYLQFADADLPIASVTVHIDDANGATKTYSATDFFGNTAGVTISNLDLHVAKIYGLTYTACDTGGNCTAAPVPVNFFHVVANVPSFASPANSFFGFTTGSKISDSVENHGTQITLADRFGNPIKSVAGIKSVQVEFVFDNTTELNQIDHTGDSAIFTSSEFALNKFPGEGTTGVLTEANNGDGVFEVDVASLAPTSAGYPIIGSGIDLNFQSVNLNISPVLPYTDSDVGGFSDNVPNSDPQGVFTFAPTIVATPTALIWDGSNYVPDPTGVNNITVNAAKRFSIGFQNQSASIGVTNPKIGVALDSGDESILRWSDSEIETAGSNSGLNEDLNLDTDGGLTFDSTFLENLTSWISGILGGGANSLRFHATPQLLVASAPENLITTLQTYPCYMIAGQEVCHRSEKLTNAGNDATLYNPGIEIIGTLHSRAGTASKTDTIINQSIGNFMQNEFKNAMNRALASLLDDSNAGRACDAGETTTITSADQFEANDPDLPCKFNNGSVIYFKDTDVTLELADETLPNSPHTIVIEGGNLLVKSNLKYPTTSGSLGSFGIIVLKNKTTDAGGNILVYPGVTNLVGAVYAEGGVISVNTLGEYGEDSSSTCTGANGFCDRSYELRNQLYWKGLLATGNTIGGSDKTSIECPTDVVCDSQVTARIYDLAYLRTFHPDSGGTRATNPATTSDASFVMGYDSRIQNNPPPLFESISSSSSSEI